jgi:hypothetical protein
MSTLLCEGVLFKEGDGDWTTPPVAGVPGVGASDGAPVGAAVMGPAEGPVGETPRPVAGAAGATRAAGAEGADICPKAGIAESVKKAKKTDDTRYMGSPTVQ